MYKSYTVILFALLIFITILSSYPSDPFSNVLAIDWKTYVSKEYGFSVQYPSNWIVTEKANRFDKDTFVSIKSKIGDSPIFDLINIAPNPPFTDIQALSDMSATSMSLQPGTRIIEGSDTTKFIIDGEATGSFTTATDIEHMPDIYLVAEFRVTIHENKMYLFGYMGLSDIFDNDEQSEIRNHMFNSIKWLN